MSMLIRVSTSVRRPGWPSIVAALWLASCGGRIIDSGEDWGGDGGDGATGASAGRGGSGAVGGTAGSGSRAGYGGVGAYAGGGVAGGGYAGVGARPAGGVAGGGYAGVYGGGYAGVYGGGYAGIGAYGGGGYGGVPVIGGYGGIPVTGGYAGVAGVSATGGVTIGCAAGCPAPYACCYDRCVDLLSDPGNCGACWNSCEEYACFEGVCSRVPNDTLDMASPIRLQSPNILLVADTSMALADGSGPCMCTTGPDVFFRLDLRQWELVYADTFGAYWDTALYLADAEGAPLGSTDLDMMCNDDSFDCVEGLQSQIQALLPPGTYYLVLSGCGAGTATINFQHLPVGNGSVISIARGQSTTVWGSTAGTGTIMSGCCSQGPEDTYYFTTCRDEPPLILSASTCALADWDTELSFSSGTGGGELSCNDDSCELQSEIYVESIQPGAGIHALYMDGCAADSGGDYELAYSLY